jgi:predicted Zn-dependent protease
MQKNIRIKACYFDGLSSNPFEVELKISALYLEIIFVNEEKESILWNIEKIKKPEELNFNTYRLCYGNFPYQSLEFTVEQYQLLISINRAIANTTKDTWYEQLLKRKSLLATFFIGFIAICTLVYFILIPAVTPLVIKYIPIETEEYLGDIVYKGMIENEEIDSNATFLINQFWEEMNYTSDYNVNITVVKNNIVNAFALPGGKIVVFDSILKLFDNHNQLSALLSHEFIHVQHKHSMNQMVSAYSRIAVVYLLLGNINDVFLSIAQNADVINTLTYSRKLEQEADLEGMKLMENARIPIKGMYQLFEKLDDSEDSINSNLLNYVSSHPATKNRINYCKKFNKSNQNIDSDKDNKLKNIFVQMRR